MPEQGHGGRAVSLALRALGVDHLFTLTGGHIFPILDGCRQDGIRIVDVRHEQTAAFAAEGWARLTRSLGVLAVTAGPGVTNALSGLAQARFNRAAVLALAGRAPEYRWGQGSLQEIDHVPFVDPLAPAATVHASAEIAARVVGEGARALNPATRGPRFLDFPLDVLFDSTTIEVPERPSVAPGDAFDPSPVADALVASDRPLVIAGSDVWLDGAEEDLRRFAEATGVPVFMNGQARGVLPPPHELAFARSRSKAIAEADFVLIAGTPLDFRLGFGQGFAPGAKVVQAGTRASAEHVDLFARLGAPLDVVFAALADAVSSPPDAKAWVEVLRIAEDERSEATASDLASDAVPIHPLRVYGELVPRLERDAVVIGDGGDFVSYAGREVPVHTPGCWLDPGPFGCLGCGPGYAVAAALAHPGRSVVLLYGDGAFGFSGMELETFVRLGLPVVCIVGNNGIWGLEKHPMRALYGYDVAAELSPGIRYDKVMEALGGHGEYVTRPDEIGPALDRAFSSAGPALVNVLTDPAVAYPRSANLA